MGHRTSSTTNVSPWRAAATAHPELARHCSTRSGSHEDYGRVGPTPRKRKRHRSKAHGSKHHDSIDSAALDTRRRSSTCKPSPELVVNTGIADEAGSEPGNKNPSVAATAATPATPRHHKSAANEERRKTMPQDPSRMPLRPSSRWSWDVGNLITTSKAAAIEASSGTTYPTCTCGTKSQGSPSLHRRRSS